MGKASAPDAPDYKGQAIATANTGKYSEVSPFGSVLWSQLPGSDPLNPQPGDSIRTTVLAPQQQALYDQQVANQLKAGMAGSSMLDDVTQGRQQTQDALYRRATQYYDSRFADSESALRARLENSGLTAGGAGYDRALRDFGRAKDTAYADATDRAIVGADASQNSAVSRLASILQLSRGQSPTSANSSGQTDFSSAAQGQYNAALGKTNAENANTTAGYSAIATILAALL